MSCEKLKKYLDDNGIHYVTITHSQAFTSQQIAASAHIKGKDLAKTVIIKIDNRFAMAVLPANKHVNFNYIRAVTGKTEVKLASEAEFRELFPDCEIGAMPPFGNLYNMDVYVSSDITKEEDIAFNGGNHAELIRMKYEDFSKLVRPRILEFAAV